jgi:hypothetical protein
MNFDFYRWCDSNKYTESQFISLKFIFINTSEVICDSVRGCDWWLFSIPFTLASKQLFLLTVFSKCLIKSLGLGSLTPLLLCIFNTKMLQLLGYIARGCFTYCMSRCVFLPCA